MTTQKEIAKGSNPHIQRRLDLEDINSAFRYMKRYAKDVIEHENTESTKNKLEP
ncbi:MAG: hypothetical protein ABSB40_11835 [Nitrososphaeria archaeon]|jgi:hypothetical protein